MIPDLTRKSVRPSTKPRKEVLIAKNENAWTNAAAAGDDPFSVAEV
jgi:hypothetical protein